MAFLSVEKQKNLCSDPLGRPLLVSARSGQVGRSRGPLAGPPVSVKEGVIIVQCAGSPKGTSEAPAHGLGREDSLTAIARVWWDPWRPEFWSLLLSLGRLGCPTGSAWLGPA